MQITSTTNTISTDLVSKIRKLLQLGTSGNEHEAERALLKARELAVRHEIDLAQIQLFTEDTYAKEQIERGEDLRLGHKLSVHQKYITWLLMHHFNVSIIYCGNRYSGKRVVFIGKKSDIEIATYVQQFLLSEFMRLWHSYQVTTGARVEVRNSYMYGLYNGLDTKLGDAKKTATQERIREIAVCDGEEKAQAVEKQYGLVCVSQKEQLKKAEKKFFPSLTHSTTSTGRIHDGFAMESGRKAGQSININRGIGSGSTKQLKG